MLLLKVSEIKTIKLTKCLTAWFQIIKTLRLVLKISCQSRLTNAFNSFRKREGSSYNKKSLTAIRLKNFQKKLWRLNWTNLSDRSTNHHFFCCFLPFCNFTKHRKYVGCACWSPNESCDFSCTVAHFAPKLTCEGISEIVPGDLSFQISK